MPETDAPAPAAVRRASELHLSSVRYRKGVLQTIVAAGAGHMGGARTLLSSTGAPR